MSKQRNKRNKNRARKIPRIPKDKKELFIKEYKKVAARENEKIKNAIADELSYVAIVALAMAAHDEFDFGRKRIMRLVTRFLNEFNAMADGYASLEDMKETLLEETGIDFDKELFERKPEEDKQ